MLELIDHMHVGVEIFASLWSNVNTVALVGLYLYMYKGVTLMPPHRPQMLGQLQTSTHNVPRPQKHKPFHRLTATLSILFPSMKRQRKASKKVPNKQVN